ncbi:MAG: hypothetical protein RIS79_2689 [Verrucomicrobiota bacterium]|jgi:hypothetical protein
MSSSSQPLIVLAAYGVRTWKDRPRRHLDIHPVPSEGRAIVDEWFESDDEVTKHHHLRPRSHASRLVTAFRLIWKNRQPLRDARFIYCLDGMHFSALLMLARVGLFKTAGKTIRRYCFHDRAVRRLAPMLKQAPPAFQLECITRQQCEIGSNLLGKGRVVFRRWKIDTEWYQPEGSAQDGACLLAGNACRDEAMVDGLLAQGIAVTRAGRADALQRRFAAQLKNPLFKLALNTSHPDYLRLLRSSCAVLLPILPCDEPAGLTAAMEALACEVPILANCSMGIAELFESCRYPLPLIDSLDPQAWAAAIRDLEAQKTSTTFREALAASRQRLLDQHSIQPEGHDWFDILGDSSPAAAPAAAMLQPV